MGYLVLTRKVGEKVMIAEGLIEVLLVSTRNGQATIGFKAPQHIRINREEVQERSRPQSSIPQEGVEP